MSRTSCLPLAISACAAFFVGTANADDVDLETSRVYVFVGKRGLGHDHAVVGRLAAGSLQLGATQGAGRLVFDMRSFRADTADARQILKLAGTTDADTQRQVNDNMLGPAVLDVARHPTAVFDVVSTQPVTPAPDGQPHYDLVGSFTLHGAKRPVSVRVVAQRVDAVVRLWGSFVIKQTDYGMTPFSKLGGVVGVSDELRIYGDIRLRDTVGPGAAASFGGTR